MAYSSVGSLCVFMAIVATSHSTTCKRCWVNGGTECCKEESIVCPGDKCMTMTESCHVDGIAYAAISKTCGNALCDRCISITSENFRSRISTQCGTGENSNAELNYKKTCGDWKPNGLKCPVCYANSSMDGCEAKGEMDCSGNEEECLEFRGKLQFPDTTMHEFSVKGCVTKGACELGFNAMPGVKEYERKIMTCTTPNGKKKY